MTRTRRKPRVSDAIVLAYRDRLLAIGYLDVLRTTSGKRAAVKVFGTTYGPGHVPPPGTERLRIHGGRGRPRAGSIGLIAALAAATGYSERVVHRALGGAPRAGTRRSASAPCPVCGRDPLVPTVEAMPLPPSWGTSGTQAGISIPGRGFDAIGLVAATPPPQAPVDPLRGCREALAEALDAALAMDALNTAAAAAARHLRSVLQM